MAGEDRDYVAWVKTLPCAMRVDDPCNGGTEAHHHREHTGLGLRPHDSKVIPLCAYHHRCLHDASGPFKHMPKEERRSWAKRKLDWVAIQRAKWIAQRKW